MVRPGVTGLYCLGTIGLPNLAFPLTASGLRYGTFSPFDRLWAALRESFSVSDSLTVETEQWKGFPLTASVAALRDTFSAFDSLTVELGS